MHGPPPPLSSAGVRLGAIFQLSRIAASVWFRETADESLDSTIELLRGAPYIRKQASGGTISFAGINVAAQTAADFVILQAVGGCSRI